MHQLVITPEHPLAPRLICYDRQDRIVDDLVQVHLKTGDALQASIMPSEDACHIVRRTRAIIVARIEVITDAHPAQQGSINDPAKTWAPAPRHTIKDQTGPQQPVKPDLDKCPKCGGPADLGHSRDHPPNPYFCSKCQGGGTP